MRWSKGNDGSPHVCGSCGSVLTKGTKNKSYCMVCCRGEGFPMSNKGTRLLKPGEKNYISEQEALSLVTLEEGDVWQILMKIQCENLPWSDLLPKGAKQEGFSIF